MTVTAEPLKSRKLRYDDPRLLLTISQAALELDRATRKEAADLSKAKAFFDFLTESITSEESNTEIGSRWVDPMTVNLFNHALQRSGRAKDLRTVSDVVHEACNVIKGIHQTAEHGTEQELADLRNFCVAFGNSLLTYRAHHNPQPPAHPYRR
jgi:hypothetical protein